MDFSLIETMRWEPGAGFVRVEQHLRRLNRSADALGFRPPPQDALQQLEAAVGGDAPMRVRLAMTYRGKIEIVATPFAPIPAGTVWRVRVANTRLPSDDPLFRHKTSRREPYEAARAEFSPEEADEVLLLNERGEICEGTITNVFAEEADGQLLTPPLTSGLLPGVLRAELIRERKARSQVLRPADIGNRKLFVGNSLRGLVAAELVGSAEQAEPASTAAGVKAGVFG
ncbi:aminotransferase class IV family protein [Rhizobium puerariae]|uniref:Probable branched-chain-amino-acid aminotransferase n=1 Tax=Rhizobium puerariae TaxID=1585791 RepID=A0ABV6APD3_9HYPH